MSYLIFDTETNTLPKNWKAPVSDTNNWPRVIQLAWELLDDKLEPLSQGSYLVKLSTGVRIDPKAQNVHGISLDRLQREGEDLGEVLTSFLAAMKQATHLVAHNYDFDSKVLGCEFIRQSGKNALQRKKSICTMKSTTDFCELPGPYGYKWPTLQQLHHKLFQEDFTGAHDAATDVAATRKCLVELVGLGVI
jgi:DNA polymerase III epsilon subunit-like protein